MLIDNSNKNRCLLICSLFSFSLPVLSQSLPELVTLTVHGHPTVAAANANIAAAKAEVDTANWQYYPSASVSVENAYASSSDADYAGDDLVTRLSVEQPLWQWGAIDAGVDIAETGVQIENARKQQQQWQLAETVIDAYGKWVASYLNMRAWEAGLEDHEALLDQVSKRVRQGVSAAIDLALAQGRVASTEAEYLASKAGLKTAVLELSQLTNSPLLNGDLADHMASPRELHVADSLSSALTVSPKVKLARAEVRLAEQQNVQQQASLKPALYLRAEHQVNSFSSANAAPQTRVFVGFSGSSGAGLSWQSKQRGNAALLQAKQASLYAEQQATEQALENLAINAESIELRLASLNMAMSTTEDVSSSYSRQFLAGRKSWQEVMNAAREKVQMQVQISDLEAAYLVSSWRYYLLTNGLAFAASDTTSEITTEFAEASVGSAK
jgi:adhesin transport system outer membrane protein